ncbi:18018_t:CDS:2 [Funneliformis geosporum]|uniref:10913_t:CDS:1 n=1 Tax=Funneliformis geosporum TaxID=1117311 RepID=A0A9W4X000_9GLOM|nr:10913_t:CDS:2 [Funneliformis geosporum]CAI2185189.1 18018_t:CDS:2 [Funneliformis geosporum]
MNPLQKSSAFLIISILLIITLSPLRVFTQKTVVETEVVTIKAPDVTVAVPPPDANPTETVVIGQPKEPAKVPEPAPGEEPKEPPKQVPNEQPKEQPKEPQNPEVTPPPQPKSPPGKQPDSTKNSSKSAVFVLTGSAPTPTNLGYVNVVEWNLTGVNIIIGGLFTFMNAWVL